MDTLDLQCVIQRKWAMLFDSFDVVLAPTFGVAAFSHDESGGERTLVINGKSTPYANKGHGRASPADPTFRASRCPLRCRRMDQPIGIQVIEPYLEDGAVIQFARLLSQKSLQRAIGVVAVS